MKIGKNLKLALRALLLKAGEIVTDAGKLIFDEDAIAVGIEVFVENTDEEGNTELVAAPDGEYKADGKIYVVAEGKVADIKDEAPAEEEVVEESEEKQKFNEQKVKFAESYNEIFAAIQNALNEAGIDGYVYDAGEGFAIVSVWENDVNKTYKYGITIDENGNVALGEREEVKQKVVYEPVDAPKEDEPAKEEMAEEEAPAAEEIDKPEEEVKSIEDRVADVEARIAEFKDGIEKILNAFAEMEDRLVAVEDKLADAEKPAAAAIDETPIEESEQPKSKLSYLRK